MAGLLSELRSDASAVSPIQSEKIFEKLEKTQQALRQSTFLDPLELFSRPTLQISLINPHPYSLSNTPNQRTHMI